MTRRRQLLIAAIAVLMVAFVTISIVGVLHRDSQLKDICDLLNAQPGPHGAQVCIRDHNIVYPVGSQK